MISASREDPGAWRYLTASLALLGREGEARVAKDELLRLMPGESLRWIREVLPSDNADRIERFVDGLRKAGVPE